MQRLCIIFDWDLIAVGRCHVNEQINQCTEAWNYYTLHDSCKAGQGIGVKVLCSGGSGKSSSCSSGGSDSRFADPESKSEAELPLGSEENIWGVIATAAGCAAAATLLCATVYRVRHRQLPQPGRATRKAEIAERGEAAENNTVWPDEGVEWPHDDPTSLPPRRRSTYAPQREG